MDYPELITRYSIRLALLCYSIVVLAKAIQIPSGTNRIRSNRPWQLLWLAGALLTLLHTALAFHFFHHWSHAAAVADTARKTRELLGFEFGIGVWANYAFATIWLADALWWCGNPPSYTKRPRWLSLSIHLFLAFIIINGAIVFEPGPTRWVGLAIGATIGVVAIWSRNRHPPSTAL